MEAGLIKVERSGNEKEGTAVSKDAPFDEATKKAVQQIPLLSVKAGPRDTQWVDRLKEEYHALIQFVRTNKANDQDWFYLKASDKEGIHWEGKCWHFHENVKYEFDLCFELPVGYPLTPPELKLPELDGKTVKMYHGGKICLTVHFQPLWTRNAPRFGIAHALALGLGPWLASEVPDLVRRGAILPK